VSPQLQFLVVRLI